MPELIESVADLTNLRDQDALEFALASLLFEQVEAIGLRLWRVIRRDGKIWLSERVCLPLPGSTTNRVAEMQTMPLAKTDPALQRCCEHKAHLHLSAEHGLFRDLFPVANERDVVCLVEIQRTSELSAAGERLLWGLIRIYCNHLALLNYGDHDELTGLLNRRTFGESFKQIVAPEMVDITLSPIRRSYESALMRIHLAVIDIDFFKRINDQFGHPYGDEVLVLLARLMGQSFRDTDQLFRFGGEEFVAILPGTDFEQAERALERLRSEVENFIFSQVGQVTVSIGFTSLRAGDTGPSAFGRADQALYVAKHAGRNQVQCYELLIANGALVSTTAKEQEVELF